MKNKTITAEELLNHITHKINTGNFTDSVHKIKLVTTQEMIQKILGEEF